MGQAIADITRIVDTSILQRLWPRLVASYALDARAQRRPDPSNGLRGRAAPAVPTVKRISRFLFLPPETPMETFASPGIGRNVRFRLPDRASSALVLEEVVVHLEVFPVIELARPVFTYSRTAVLEN
jgi:hypothetical protein